MLRVYLASPLGFSPEWTSYRDKIKARLIELGCTILDPWDQPFQVAIREAHALTDWPARSEALMALARKIGKTNEGMILTSDAVLGVLDGAEVDSGTASELGYGAGIDKTCYGLRTDFRNCGDFDGIPVNLQVLWWIESSGGKLFRKIDEILL